MKILILSRDKNYYSTKRLVTEARKLRHKAQVIDPLECEISIKSPHPPFAKGEKGGLETKCGFTASANKQNLSDFDIVIPRIGIVGVDYALLVAHQLEFMGKPMLNSARSMDYTKNKFLALQILCKSGIPVPDTLMISRSNRDSAAASRDIEKIKASIKKLGGLPVVMKLFRGSQGKGVMLGENLASVESILASVWAIGFDIILQKYLKETKGTDIRVLVLGNEVITAMKRTPGKGDFRSNVHQGGKMQKVAISAQEKQMALRATRALGLKLAGIDIMRTRKGPLVLEANASPGFEGLEKLTGINIAKKILEYACWLV